MFRRIALFMGLFGSAALLVSPETASAGQGWVIKDSMTPLIKDFEANADELDNFRNFDIPNDFVYIKDSGEGPLLPIYDLIACIKLTNPDSEIITGGFGGSLDVAIDSVAFAKGSWPVKINVTRNNKLRDLKMVSTYTLKTLRIGANGLTDTDQMVNALRLMTKACLAD